MGEAYARNRNFDLGPDDRSNVSLLSPYVRSRLVLEEELIERALHKRSLQEVEKFVQEVFWRAYWKGWLELRPHVWDEYQKNLKIHLGDAMILERYHAACSGNTPYECFNSWGQELNETGYLHNHARMWFASIWIFYLGLPWELGADYFYQRLLDGDAASNTLSWRWVAGLQTVGKQYVADSANIEKYTVSRFSVKGLNASEIQPLKAVPPSSHSPAAYEYLTGEADDAKRPSILLLTDEDLLIEKSLFSTWNIQRVIGLSPQLIQNEQQLSDLVLNFRSEALKDGMARAKAHFGVEATTVLSASELSELLRAAAKERAVLALMRPRVGYWKDFLGAAGIGKQSATFPIVTMRERAWDSLLYPRAVHGFFKFKDLIPLAIRDLGKTPDLQETSRGAAS
jgi:deoxyribodipyrimidine photo-lyase